MGNASAIRNRVAVLLAEDGKVLLVQHEKCGRRYWLLPGGGVEYGETLEETARRELKEETNLEITVGDLLFVSESIPPDRHRHVINYYFEGKVTGGALRVPEEKVLKHAQWHCIEDLPHLIIYPTITRELLEWVQTGSIKRRSIGNRWE
ncbi:MAG: NUDIX domain-containing protein [bacterium]